MLIAVQYLIDRLRHQRSRADEVAALRRALVREPQEVPAAEAAAARELAELRVAMSRAIGEVSACHSCAQGHPRPHGRWNGGHCCGATTFDLFNKDEVAALRLSGTTPGHLRPPRAEDHAGCAFRGPRGCSLQAIDRPTLCVRYVCPDLARELALRGDLDAVEAIGARMEEIYNRFATLRRDRLEEEELRG